MRIIGVGGTDGSGKDTIGEVLAGHGWLFVSVTDLLRDEAKRRGLPLDRPNLRKISTEWRRQSGLGVLVDKALEVFKQQRSPKKPAGLALASLRNPGEADRVHELGGQVIWVDADPKIRYQRIMARQRGTEDQVSFEDFLAEEQVQMKPSGDESTLSLSAVKAKADVFIANNSSDLEAFKTQVAQTLGLS